MCGRADDGGRVRCDRRFHVEKVNLNGEQRALNMKRIVREINGHGNSLAWWRSEVAISHYL